MQSMDDDRAHGLLEGNRMDAVAGAIQGRMTMITLDEAIEILSRPKTMKGTPQDILEAHDMAITALRQPEIIRCRECKLRDTEYCNMAHGFMGMKDDDHCSYGERREVSE